MEARSLFTKSLSLPEMERFLHDYDEYIRRNYPPGYAKEGGDRTTHRLPNGSESLRGQEFLVVQFNWGSLICRYEVFVFVIAKNHALLRGYTSGIRMRGQVESRLVGSSVEVYEKPWHLTAEEKRQLRAAHGAKGQRMPLNEREERIALISLL